MHEITEVDVNHDDFEGRMDSLRNKYDNQGQFIITSKQDDDNKDYLEHDQLHE